MIVADCTLIARLIIGAEDPRRAEALRLREQTWAAPVLWEAEFASVLSKYERAGLLSAAGAALHARRALELFEHTTHHVAMERALESARRSGCSSYDGYYVALSEDLGVKLFTYDKGILQRCRGLALQP